MQGLGAAMRSLSRAGRQLARGAEAGARNGVKPLPALPTVSWRCPLPLPLRPDDDAAMPCSPARRGGRRRVQHLRLRRRLRRQRWPCGGALAVAPGALGVQEAGRVHPEHQGLAAQVPGREAVWGAGLRAGAHHRAAARHRVPPGARRGHGAWPACVRLQHMAAAVLLFCGVITAAACLWSCCVALRSSEGLLTCACSPSSRLLRRCRAGTTPSLHWCRGAWCSAAILAPSGGLSVWTRQRRHQCLLQRRRRRRHGSRQRQQCRQRRDACASALLAAACTNEI